jgi:hypothetical protein
VWIDMNYLFSSDRRHCRPSTGPLPFAGSILPCFPPWLPCRTATERDGILALAGAS